MNNQNKGTLKVNDDYKDAQITLEEAMKLLSRLRKIQMSLESFDVVSQSVPNLTMPKYLQMQVKILMQQTKFDYATTYPNLRTHYINGDGIPHAAGRLASMTSRLSDLINSIRELKFIIKNEETRVDFYCAVKGIIADLLLYMTAQYRLDSANGTQYLPTFLYCEKQEIVYSKFCEQIGDLRKVYNAEFYIYELPCPEAEQFLEFFPQLEERAEDLHFPLTISRAREILDNPDLANDLNAEIDNYANNIESCMIKTNQSSILKRMSF